MLPFKKLKKYWKKNISRHFFCYFFAFYSTLYFSGFLDLWVYTSICIILKSIFVFVIIQVHNKVISIWRKLWSLFMWISHDFLLPSRTRPNDTDPDPQPWVQDFLFWPDDRGVPKEELKDDHGGVGRRHGGVEQVQRVQDGRHCCVMATMKEQVNLRRKKKFHNFFRFPVHEGLRLGKHF